MNSDSHFVIGSSHLICQDYAITGGSQFAPISVLSDGCSCVLDQNGKPKANVYTETGAMLLSHAAMRFLRLNHLEVDGYPDLRGKEAIEYSIRKIATDAIVDAIGLGISTDSLFATLGFISSDSVAASAYLCGDGLIASRFAGTNKWNWVFFQNRSKPYYPIYSAIIPSPDPEKLKEELGETFFTIHKEGETIRFDVIPEYEKIQFGFATSQEGAFDMLVVMSDGVSSFSKNGKPANLEEIINRFLEFRSTKGRFVVRQLRGVIKELKQDGYDHSDDVSMIAIQL